MLGVVIKFHLVINSIIKPASGGNLKNSCYRFLLIFIVSSFFTTNSYSQFIANRGDENPESYRNYSGRNYENYSSQFIKKKFFDNFGNFLIEGTTIYELSEVQGKKTEDENSTATRDIIKSR